eukprot:Gb_10744 [translate_table: standard]
MRLVHKALTTLNFRNCSEPETALISEPCGQVDACLCQPLICSLEGVYRVFHLFKWSKIAAASSPCGVEGVFTVALSTSQLLYLIPLERANLPLDNQMFDENQEDANSKFILHASKDSPVYWRKGNIELDSSSFIALLHV